MRATDGRQLRAARAALGLTVEEAAALAGVNRNTITRAEKLARITHREHGAMLIGAGYERAGCLFGAADGLLQVAFSAAPAVKPVARDKAKPALLNLAEWRAARSKVASRPA